MAFDNRDLGKINQLQMMLRRRFDISAFVYRWDRTKSDRDHFPVLTVEFMRFMTTKDSDDFGDILGEFTELSGIDAVAIDTHILSICTFEIHFKWN